MIKTLKRNMSVANLNDIEAVAIFFYEFFVRSDYDWWRPVQPGDIDVDIGANIGMFTCLALDRGAKKVYAIEPSLELLQTTMYNATPHIVNKKESPLIPINCAIGSTKDTIHHVYGPDKNNFEIKSFKDILQEYNIDKIDFLKIDCEGGEYDILTEENLDFIKRNVRHIAVEMHIDAHKDAPALYDKFRETFLPHFNNVKFLNPRDATIAYERNKKDQPWPRGPKGGWWLMYICNHDI